MVSRDERLEEDAWSARGETGVDNRFAERSFENIGAWILGRNMFGPVRGPWPDDSWKGGGATSRHTTCRYSC